MVGTTVWLGARRTLLLPAAWRPGPPLPPAAMMLCTRFQLRNAATDTTSELIKTAVLVEKAYEELQLKNIQHQVPIVAVPPPSSSSSSSSSSSPFCKPLHQAHRHSFPEASGRCAGSAACESSQSISHCNAQNCSRKQQQSLLLYAVIVPHVAAIFGLNLF